MTNDFAQREVDFILSVGGVTVEYGKALGRDITLAQLRADYDAVFLGIGHNAVNALRIEGEDLAGVSNAVDFIAELRQAADKSVLPVGRKIVVIGGGNTAIDVATQSKRLGAEDVTIVYRRGPESMSATGAEQEWAQTNGVRIKYWAQPRSLLGAGGSLREVEFEYTVLDEAGRLAGTGEFFRIPADMVFKAIGQSFVPAAVGDGSLGRDPGVPAGRAVRGERGPADLAGECVCRRGLYRGDRPDRLGGSGRQGGGAGDPSPAQRFVTAADKVSRG